MKRVVILDEQKGIPLLGLLYIGIVDRGTNLIQVRPTTICNLNCPFCSVDSGACSKVHKVDFIAEKNYLLRYIKEIVEYKGKGTEVNLDTVGEILTYPDLIELIKGIKEFKEVERISMQTNGVLLTKKLIKDLEEAGLNQINLSLLSMDKAQASELSGVANYSLEHLLEMARLINKSKIKLLIAPVWIPKVNDMGPIIEFCKELKCKIGIQKYEVHKFGRKMKGVKEITYFKFFKEIEELEKKFEMKLKLNASDFNIKRVKRVPDAFNRGDEVHVVIKEEGWGKDQFIGVTKNRAVTILRPNAKIGQKLNIKTLSVKDGVYMAK
jgi:uncharacterized Fe-S cluster-containing radical SAM superfamily enzyme